MYKDSSYYRIFRHVIIIVFCALVAIGVITVSTSTALFRKAELERVKSAGDLFISCISEPSADSGADYIKAGEYYTDKIAYEQGIRIYVFDEKGKCVVSPNGDASAEDDMSAATMAKLEDDDILGLNSKFFSHRSPALMYMKKVPLREYYILAAATTEGVDNFMLLAIIVYSSIAVILFAGCFIIMRIVVNKHIMFEENFLRIAEKYAKDDFSEKLSTDISPNLIHICDLVNTLASNIENSEETSKTFIANVSHELRTPMTTIGGFVDGILDGTIPKVKQSEYLVLVSQEIHRLRILISSMLNMSRFEQGTLRPNFRETNLTDLVIQVVLMFEKRIEEKHLNVEELDSSRITAVVDSDLLQQVIYNLVENAVKFVNEGGTLSFTFDKNYKTCIIGIRNTGEGLNDTEIQQVFDRFYKTDSSRGKDVTGLGLGLSISRKIVHLHNGHIVVKSVYGEYTEFQIHIPEDCTTGQKA